MGNSPESKDVPPRRIELRHAIIHIDGSALHRTAHFTDGSVKGVALSWSGITRVGAFRCDAPSPGILCLAVTDTANVVILDERMAGWDSILQALPTYLAGTPSPSEWRKRVAASPGVNWMVLFTSRP